MAKLTFTAIEYETLKNVVEQITSSPTSLGISQSNAEDLYDAVFRPSRKPIDQSCVPCMVLGGECCGMFYWHDDGRVVCNECGREATMPLSGQART